MLVFISHFKEEPLAYEATDVETGVLTSILLRKRANRMLPGPYNACADLANFNSILYKEITRHGHAYRRGKCLILCYQKLTYEQCGCYDLYFEGVFDARPCLRSDELECTYRTYKQFLSDMSACDALCPVRCDKVTYDQSVFVSEYPSQMYYERLRKNPDVERNLENETVELEIVKENLLAVRKGI